MVFNSGNDLFLQNCDQPIHRQLFIYLFLVNVCMCASVFVLHGGGWVQHIRSICFSVDDNTLVPFQRAAVVVWSCTVRFCAFKSPDMKNYQSYWLGQYSIKVLDQIFLHILLLALHSSSSLCSALRDVGFVLDNWWIVKIRGINIALWKWYNLLASIIILVQLHYKNHRVHGLTFSTSIFYILVI